jgi:sec-independent protein translocase protein TatC
VTEQNRLSSIILDLRRSLLLLAAAIAASTAFSFFLAPAVLNIFQNHLGQKLSFFTVAEPFLAHLKLALATAAFATIPFLTLILWRALAKSFGLSPANVFWFTLFTCLLFYAGSFFCFFFTLPFGIKFLLGFQSVQLQPVISIGQFVTFVTMFILAFGVIFELPVFMIFAAKTGLITRQAFARNRRYAVLAISIMAALLTPTPDVMNMLLMGGPLYLLYEAGIFVLRIMRLR